jgi:hypothetical protein
MVYQTTCEQSKAQFSLTSGGPRVTSGTPDYAEPGKRRSRSQNPDDLVLIPVFSSKWTENGSFPWVRKKKRMYSMDDRGSESSNGEVQVMTQSEMDEEFVDGW